MFGPINPRNEELRAQAMLDTLTDYNRAADAFAPKHAEVEATVAEFETNERVVKMDRSNGRSNVRVFQGTQAEQLSCC